MDGVGNMSNGGVDASFQGLPAVEATKVIGIDEIRKAEETLQKYKKGKAKLDERVIQNEDWWKLQHWRNFKSKSRNPKDPEPVSAWLFNSINNKHADFMDNFPSPNVLPREQSDEEAADVVSSILPVILEQCDFEQTYSDNTTDKLKNGAAIYGIYFNPRKLNGLGDIDIKDVDILNFFWEPGIQDVQDSRNIFVTELVDKDILVARYPDLEGKVTGGMPEQSRYNYDDEIDTTDKIQVVDWYYKKAEGGRDILHYVKYVGDNVLFASENEAGYENGFYDHAQYPFVFDVLFPEKGTPAGFGYIDIMKSPQEYIDKLNQAFLENAQWASKPRVLVKDKAGINEAEFCDISKQIVHVSTGSDLDDVVMPIASTPLSGNYLQVLQHKVDELKETSGNRDFSQGATAAGVTAASAIAALQEAGSKTSRDMIKGSYRAFTKICIMVIELMRQFYDEPRTYRITGEGGTQEYVSFDNRALKPEPESDEFGVLLGGRSPIFDIKVKAQKSSPYAREAQNELALNFYNLGFFNPEQAQQATACLELMEFEGKEKLRDMIQENNLIYQEIEQMRMQMAQMAQVIAESTGDKRLLAAMNPAGLAEMEAQEAVQAEMQAQAEAQIPDVDSSGELITDDHSRVAKAKAKAAKISEVR